MEKEKHGMPQQSQHKQADGEKQQKPPKEKQQQKQSSSSASTGTTDKATDQHMKKQQPKPDAKNDGKDKSSAPKPNETKQSNQSTSSTGPNAAKTVNEKYQLNLFDHLPKKSLLAGNIKLSIEKDVAIHPATTKLGCMYRTGIIRDDDDRVAALVAAFCKVIEDYTTPPNQSLNRDLDKHIKAQVQHLVDNRQHCMGMGNLIKYLRSAIASTPPAMPESEAKQRLINILRQFLEEKIVFARESIIQHCSSVVKKDDLILTFGSSSLLRQVLLGIAEIKNYRLVVVDSRPLNDGLRTLAALSPHIRCIYTNLSGVSAIMREVSRVLIGASSLLSNGAVLAPAGTAMVAALAKANRIPVVVVAETYKFSEKVQLDSIVYNELGNPSELMYMKGDEPTSTQSHSESSYKGSADSIDQRLLSPPWPFQVINARYDITPMSHVSVVAAETGLIPPTSIPVLIREFISAEKLDQKSQ